MNVSWMKKDVILIFLYRIAEIMIQIHVMSGAEALYVLIKVMTVVVAFLTMDLRNVAILYVFLVLFVMCLVL